MKKGLELFNSNIFEESLWLPQFVFHDDKYKQLQSNIATVEPLFPVVYAFDFPKAFNSKTKFYYTLVVNEAIGFCNSLFNLVNESETENLKLFEVNIAIKKLIYLLRETERIIHLKDYEPKYYDPKQDIKHSDPQHKANAYILNLQKTVLVYIYLEIQHSFKEYFKTDILDVSEIYSQILEQAVPDSLPVSLIEPIEELNPKKLKKGTAINTSHFKQVATNHLLFLKGLNVQKNKIMSDADFERLSNYTYYLIENNKLPDNIIKIPQIDVSALVIRYTYYLIHKELYTTSRIRTEWIDFLHQVFKQFENTEWATLKTKFSTKPPSYEADMRKMVG